jgi:hypothetical protein
VSNQSVLLCSGLTECSFLLCLSTEWQYKLHIYITRGTKMLLSYTHTHFCISFKEDEVDMKNSFVNKFKFLSFTAEVQALHCTCLWWFLQCNVLCKVSWRLQNGWLYCTYFLFSKYRSYFLGFLVQK